VLTSNSTQFARCHQETYEESTALSPPFWFGDAFEGPAKKDLTTGGARLRIEKKSQFGCNQEKRSFEN
jgi:hypothetical protein